MTTHNLTNGEATRIREVYASRVEQPLHSITHPAQLFLLQQLERDILSTFRRHSISLPDQRILEVGCGSGYWLRQFVKWGAQPKQVTGIDLMPGHIELARMHCPVGTNLAVSNAAELPYDDGSFDLIAQFIMCSSVLCPKTKRAIAHELLRVLASGGVILWHDFFVNNPQNPNVRGIGFQELVSMFPGCTFHVRRVTLAPPISRFLAPYSWTLCHTLERIRAFNAFYLGVIRKE